MIGARIDHLGHITEPFHHVAMKNSYHIDGRCPDGGDRGYYLAVKHVRQLVHCPKTTPEHLSFLSGLLGPSIRSIRRLVYCKSIPLASLIPYQP